MTDEGEVLRELRKLSKILLLSNASTVEKELEKVATTKERKKMWVLIDGQRMPKDIAGLIGTTAMSLSRFLNAALAANLIEYKHGEPPQRLLDYVPPAWIESTSLDGEETAKATSSEKPATTLDNITTSETTGESE